MTNQVLQPNLYDLVILNKDIINIDAFSFPDPSLFRQPTMMQT